MTTKNSFVMYNSYKELFERLSMEERGQVITAIFEYQKEGKTQTELTCMADLLFAVIKNQLNMDREKYESVCLINRENGQKGGRPAKKT